MQDQSQDWQAGMTRGRPVKDWSSDRDGGGEPSKKAV